MKGIINKGLQEFVESQLGAETWDQVKEAAGCREPFFALSSEYPDSMTQALVAAAAAATGMEAKDTMVAYGRWLVPNTLQRQYHTFFLLAGDEPRAFLRNMNRIHSQVTRAVPGAQPPEFEYADMADGRLQITYRSQRHLCPVLHGLILGVGDLFGQELGIAHTACYLKGNPHCIMEVTFP